MPDSAPKNRLGDPNSSHMGCNLRKNAGLRRFCEDRLVTKHQTAEIYYPRDSFRFLREERENH
jgi:hypothetical protein